MCEHNRQLVNGTYAVCLDCGAEMAVVKQPAVSRARVSLVPLTDAQRAFIRDEARVSARHHVDDRVRAVAAEVLKLMEG